MPASSLSPIPYPSIGPRGDMNARVGYFIVHAKNTERNLEETSGAMGEEQSDGEGIRGANRRQRPHADVLEVSTVREAASELGPGKGESCRAELR